MYVKFTINIQSLQYIFKSLEYIFKVYSTYLKFRIYISRVGT